MFLFLFWSVAVAASIIFLCVCVCARGSSVVGVCFVDVAFIVRFANVARNEYEI